MNVMKTSLTIIPNVSSGALLSLLENVQAYPLLHKGLGHLAALYLLYLLVTRYYLSYHKTIYHLQFQCLQKTLLKTAYHFLLLLVGFDTLTYRKDYDRSLHLWVMKTLFWRVAGECSAFGEWNLVRKHLYSVLKFSVTCHYGN